MKANNYFLPAGDPERQRQRPRIRRHGRRSHRPQQVLLLRQRGEHAPADDGRHRVVELRRERSAQCSDDGRCATGNFSGTNTVIYDPLTGAANGSGRVPFAFANCGITSTSRSAIRLLQLHSGEPHQPDREVGPRQAGRAHTAGISVQLLRDEQVRHGLPEVRRQADVGAEQPDYRQRAARLRDELRGQRARAAVCGYRWHRHEWPKEPDLAGAHLGLHGPQSLAGDHRYLSAERSSWTACSALRARTCWLARTRMTAGETMFGIPNTCQPPYGRSTAFPAMNASTWSISGGGEPRAYRDPQWGGEPERRLDQEGTTT